MPAGRPSKYKPEYCEQLIEHMSGGLSIESFAGVVKVARDTLTEWANKHPEFSAAKKRGEALSYLWWEKLGKAAMIGNPVPMPDGKILSFANFNTTIWIFSMKNRFGWRDKQEVTQQTTLNGGYGIIEKVNEHGESIGETIVKRDPKG